VASFLIVHASNNLSRGRSPRVNSYRVIDAHVHFWDPGALHYSWLGGAPELERAFLPDDFESLSAGSVDGVVFVEANCRPTESTAECDFVDALAEHEPRIMGTVAFLDLCDAPNRPRALDALARRDRVVGVRHNIQGQPSGFSLQAEFVRGVQEVGRHALTFDLCVTADQLPEVAQLVGRCPDTSFVLDHCGKPAISNDAFEPWATDLARLAEHQYVACKLSGLLSEARPDQRREADLSRYAQHAMTCFGAGRLMYGSDWPVVTTAGGDRAWRALADEFTSEWTVADRQAFFCDNAVRLYGLRPTPSPRKEPGAQGLSVA
jgi:L-fuconolactonase